MILKYFFLNSYYLQLFSSSNGKFLFFQNSKGFRNILDLVLVAYFSSTLYMWYLVIYRFLRCIAGSISWSCGAYIIWKSHNLKNRKHWNTRIFYMMISHTHIWYFFWEYSRTPQYSGRFGHSDFLRYCGVFRYLAGSPFYPKNLSLLISKTRTNIILKENLQF